jgi:hypothetical protein
MTIIIAILIGAIGEILLEKYCPSYKNFCYKMWGKIFSAPFSNTSSNAEQIRRIRQPRLLDRYKILKKENEK